MKKIILLALILSSTSYAQEKSINPERVILNLFQVFSGARVQGEQVRVVGVSYDFRRDEYTKAGKRFYVEKSEFDRIHDLALSVFETKTGSNSEMMGTSVHVGENFVLTNHHVLSPDRSNKSECKSFSIKLNHNQNNRWLSCKKVHYCNEAYDYCLIEMNAHRRGDSLDRQTPPKFKGTEEMSEHTQITAIGNTRGFGIHGSIGRGYFRFSPEFTKFYAPIFHGNSGGPIFSDDDRVVGLARAQSKEIYSREAFNVAIPMDTIMEQLEKTLSKEVFSRLQF